MPPTVNPPQPAGAPPVRRPATSGSSSGAAGGPGDRRVDMVCRVKYCNTLPDLPFDPKFITYPFDATRFIQYKSTSLEKTYKYELLAEHDLGITIDLINPDAYATKPNAEEGLDYADEKLLEEDTSAAGPKDQQRSARHKKNVSWLRRTEYISTEATRFQPMTIEKVEAKVGYSMKKKAGMGGLAEEENDYRDHESQIKAIEKTFADAKKPILEHSTKKGVTPVEILPLLPDFKLWKYPCAQVMFDANPAPTDKPVSVQVDEMSQAMIRGVMDETGEQFVAYFLPTKETLEKRAKDVEANKDYDDEEEYDYKMARQYHWNVKSKASSGYEENYFIVFRGEAAHYNELETRVRLSKRRPKPGEPATSNTRLVLRHRSLTAREHKMFRQREKQLEPANQIDDEEEEEEMEEDEEQIQSSSKKEDIDEAKESKDADKGSESGSDRSGSGSRSSRSRSRSKSNSPAKSGGSRSSRSSSSSSSGSASSAASGSRSRSSSPAASAASGSPKRSPSPKPTQGSPKRASSGSGSSSASSSPGNSSSSSASSSDSE